MNSTRCFIAIPVVPPAMSVVQRMVGRLKNSVDHVKWTKSDQLHITIKFLGELDNRDLVEVCRQMRVACAGLEPFTASLNGVGTFPRNKPPKIVWARVDAGCAQLEELYHQLDASLSALGVPQEGKAFTPHLTLGRVGRGADLELLTETLQASGPELQAPFDVDQIVLYTSIRERGGVVYEAIDQVELGDSTMDS